jgi:hypothetical protein
MRLRGLPSGVLALAPGVLALGLLGAPGGAGAAERIAGNVLVVDAEGGQITVIDAGRRHTIAIAPDTAIRAAGQNRAVKDLRRGDRIVITLDEADPGRAVRVSVAGPGLVTPGASIAGANVPGFATGLNARTPPR